jgi:c-di-GMP-binding flagellar brake protein YcgR
MEIRRWIREDCIVNVSPAMEGEQWYAVKVVEVGDGSFSIAPPNLMAGDPAIETGRKIRVSVPTREGLFLFHCSVLVESGESPSRIELEYPKEVVHLERRAFPRLPIRLETEYAEIRHNNSGLNFSRSRTIDISGGGMCLESNRICPRETLLRVKFQIPLGQMEEELILTGRIVRSVPGEGARKSQLGVEFIDITPRQQEYLAQFVLDRTRGKELPA